jgi:hypothetical protein
MHGTTIHHIGSASEDGFRIPRILRSDQRGFAGGGPSLRTAEFDVTKSVQTKFSRLVNRRQSIEIMMFLTVFLRMRKPLSDFLAVR